MIFQPGVGGSGGGLSVESGSFVGSRTLKNPAKAVFVNFDDSHMRTLVPGNSISIESPEYGTFFVSLSSDGMSLETNAVSFRNSAYYLALS